MTTKTNRKADPMQDIYSRLRNLGLNKKWVQDHIMPEWWEDELASVPATRSEIEIHLARTLGLDLETLRDPSSELRFRPSPRARFKSHKGHNPTRLELSRALGVKLGALAAHARPMDSTKANDLRQALGGQSAQNIRGSILETGAFWIGLAELLQFTWSLGVPVVRAHLPEGHKKADGMALCPQGRPVILSFCGRTSPAWHAFILAHELGHHVLGHVGSGGEILDEGVRSAAVPGDDDEEVAANTFAVELLTGTTASFSYEGSWPDAPTLAKELMQLGHLHQVDPGVIALNMSHHKPEMRPLAMKTLQLLEQNSDCGAIYQSFYEELDAERWTDDETAFFERMTQL